jgi:hypothetical protein
VVRRSLMARRSASDWVASQVGLTHLVVDGFLAWLSGRKCVGKPFAGRRLRRGRRTFPIRFQIR